MGYRVRVQKVDRPTNRSYYVNFPSPIADAVGMQKGEELEWFVEDRNTFLIKRVKPAKSFLKKPKPLS
jgi:bifunctional DNA-binding transcriptional regulator/antitoxin component of YhaV-PrlF toxin-antitoxin module